MALRKRTRGGVGNNDNLESAKHLCGSLAKVTKVCFQVQVPDLLMTTMWLFLLLLFLFVLELMIVPVRRESTTASSPYIRHEEGRE